MKKRGKRFLSLGLSLTVVLMLAGCNTSTQPAAGPEENHASQAMPTPTPTPSPEATPTYYDLSTAAANGFRIEMGTLKGYSGPNSDIFIPEGVINVVSSMKEDGMFCDSGIRSVHFPSSIKEVRDSALDGCKNLEIVEFAPGEDIVINDAFNNNDSLTSVILAEGITIIRGFNRCEALTSISFPEGVTDINGFDETGLTEVIFPESTNYIGGFGACEQLTSVTIPNKDARIWEKDIVEEDLVEEDLVEEDLDEEKRPVRLYWTFQYCPNLTIHAPAGGTVEEYATRHNIPFSPL